jgi:Zn-dependent protease with chaperone function
MLAAPEEAIALLRSALPWWGIQGLWLPALLATALCSLLGTWAAIRVASGPLRRLPADAPWYERARHLQPAQSASLLGLVLPAVAFGVLVLLERGPLLTVPVEWAIGAIVLVALLASAGPRRELLELRGRSMGSRRALLRDDAVGLLLLAPHLGVALAMALLLRPPFDARDALVLAAGVAATALVATTAGLPLLRALGLVRPAPERVRALVAATAARLQIEVARVEVVEWSFANAFALPLRRSLVFTGRCCEVLDDEQLAAIAAHELGHLAEPRPVRIARFASGFLLLPFGAAPLLVGSFGLWGLAMPVGLMLLAALLLQRLMQRLEVRADQVAQADELSPGRYARALEALYRDNGAPMVGSRRRAPHPHLYDRMCAAGHPPDHPRPPAPSRVRGLAGGLISAGLTFPIAIFLLLAPYSARFERDPEARVLALRQSVALRSGRDDLLALAMALGARGEIEQALAVTRAAAALQLGEPAVPAFQASLHSRRRECPEAEWALGEARSRARAADIPEDDAWLVSAERWVESCHRGTTTARRD